MFKNIKKMAVTIGVMMTGVVVGMMIAPKKGKEFRKDVTDAMCNMKNMVMKKECCDNCEDCEDD